MAGWWTSDRKAYALQYLVDAGLSLYGATGLVSRWANVESTAQGPFSTNSIGAFGIAQWLGARKSGVYPNTDFDAQLAYVIQELNGSEARAGALLRSASDTGSGARAATAYERAEHYSAASNTDDWTAKTAAGIPAVIALAGGSVNNADVVNTDPGDDTGSAISLPLAIGIAAGAVILLWMLSD